MFSEHGSLGYGFNKLCFLSILSLHLKFLLVVHRDEKNAYVHTQEIIFIHYFKSIIPLRNEFEKVLKYRL